MKRKARPQSFNEYREKKASFSIYENPVKILLGYDLDKPIFTYKKIGELRLVHVYSFIQKKALRKGLRNPQAQKRFLKNLDAKRI